MEQLFWVYVIATAAGLVFAIEPIWRMRMMTAVGLLMWGAATVTAHEPTRYESAPALGGLGRIRDAIRSIFP